MKIGIEQLVFSLLLLFLGTCLNGQTKGRNPGYLEYEQYTMLDGFPTMSAEETLQDKKGFLWIASFEGLVRYDGYDFKLFQPTTSHVSNRIRNIYEDAQGNILCSNRTSLWRFDVRKEQFFPFNLNDSGRKQKTVVQDFVEDKFGNIWIATATQGLQIISNKKMAVDSTLSWPGLKLQQKQKEILALVDSLQGKDLIQVLKVGNDFLEKKTFELNDSQDFIVISYGEFTQNGTWTDMGWLEDNQEAERWRPSVANSYRPGYQYFNRIALEEIRLPSGAYSLYYKSDSIYSFTNFLNSPPPFPHLWGIQLIPITKDKNRLELLKLVKQLQDIKNSERWLSNQNVYSLHKDTLGNIFVGTVSGLDVFSTQAQNPPKAQFPYERIQHFQFEGIAEEKLLGCQVLKIAEGSNNEVWITGYNPYLDSKSALTLEKFNFTDSKFRQVSAGVDIQRKVNFRGWVHYINDVIEDDHGNLWISGSHNGLYHLPKDTLQGINPNQLTDDQFSYPFDPRTKGPIVLDLTKDQNANIWVSTDAHCIYKLKGKSQKIDFFELPKSPTGQTNIPFKVHGDKQDRLWITTKNMESLFVYNSKVKKVQKVQTSPPGDTKFIGGFYTDKKGNTWFAATGGYIAKYDNSNTKIIYYKIARDLYTYPFTEDSNGDIWVTDSYGGFYIFDSKNEEIKSSSPLGSDYPNHGDIGLIKYIDSTTIWISSKGQHITRVKNYAPLDSTATTISHYEVGSPIICFENDLENNLWLGTREGLFLFNEVDGVTKKFTMKDGLLSNYICGIYWDSKRQLWLHTAMGLQLFNPENEVFSRMNSLSSIPVDFGYRETYVDPDGRLYAAAGDRIYSFYLDSMTIDSIAPLMAITDIFVNNSKDYLLDNKDSIQNFSYSQNLTLPHFNNTLALSYAGIHYDNPKEHQYAYRLLGLNDQWQEVGTERTARFNKLSPGQYTFEVKAANMDGVWTDKPAQLDIMIMAPWFWNGWSKLLYLLAGMGLLFYAYQFQLNRQLAEAEARRLAELDTVKTKLYTNITHEFRTPLTVISGMAEEVLENPQKWFREGLEMIKRNSNHLLQLVNQLLDLSKLESGSLQVTMVQDDMVSYLKYLVESFQSFARSKEIQLSIISKIEDLNMDFDPTKTQSICSNLLSNAIKFTPNGGVIQVEIDEIQGQKEPRYCQIRISDSGPGIPENVLPYIFDRFYQVDNSATRQAEGTGIGLALTKELVEILQGEIEVESKMGVGTTFIVKLPISRTAEASNAQVLLDPVSTDGTLSTLLMSDTAPVADQEQPSILLIEDNADVLQYLTSCLADHYQLSIALNGEEGIEKAIDSIPDIIISDVMMPKKDGFEVLQTLKNDERTSHIPIVMLTAKADIKSRIEGLEYGADAYLAKPFHKTELLVRLRKLIELRKVLQLHYQQLTPDSTTINKTIMKEDAFLLKVRRSVESHISDENFGISELCDVLAISRTQLHRKLKAVTGKSTSYVVRSIRLKKAKTLLQNTELNVSEVGYEVGYANSSHFAQDFRKEFGQAPSKFKKK